MIERQWIRIRETPGAAISPGQIVLSGRSGSSADVNRRLELFIDNVRLELRYQRCSWAWMATSTACSSVRRPSRTEAHW